MAKVERNVREFLSDWHVWVGIAYFGLAAVVVALYVLFGRTAHEEAIRAAASRSAASTQVGQCFTSVKNAPVAAGFIDAHEALINNSLLANQAALSVSPPDDPLRSVRVASIARLKRADANVKDLRRLIRESTPTEKKCVRLAHILGVDPDRYLRLNQ